MSDVMSSPFVAAVRELGPSFAAQAAESDRSADFVFDNYRALKERRLLSAGVPKDLGGGGASHAELCEMLRELAQFCPSTALALSMHTHLVAAAVWRHLHGQPAAPLLRKVSEGELVLVSTGAQDWLESTGQTTRVDGGYRVTAQKRFASGSPAGDLVLTSAPYDDPQEGAVVLQFAVPIKSEGIRSSDDWNTLGMRATGSHTLAFENVFVPDAAVAMKRPRGVWHPVFNVICTLALPLIVSVYVGVAEAAAVVARESARKRTSDPILPFTLGEMENALVTAQMARREMIASAANYDFAPELERANAALIRKTIAAEAVERAVKRAFEATGGSAFFKKNPLEKLFRDIQAVHFHPLPEKKQLLFSGRLAMGLPPVA
jgi:alkylation response protein AidB-like acyl-CoA dehydrogenase